MMTIKAIWDGEEQEFQVLGNGEANWTKSNPTHFINSVGTILPLGMQRTTHPNWLYLRRINKQHEFGGITYEESGRREATRGEWFMYDNEIHPNFCVIQRTSIVQILHPVGLTEGS